VDLALGVNVNLIYDLLDESRPTGGGILIGELIIALDTAGSGSHMPLKPDQLVEKATKQVAEHMGFVQNETKEHRFLCRKRMSHDTDTVPKKLALGHASDPRAYFCSSLVWQRTYGNRPSSRGMIAAMPLPVKSSPQAFQKAVAPSTPIGKPGTPIDNPNASPRPITDDNAWAATLASEKSWHDQKLDLNAFCPVSDLCSLPKSRQRARPLEPPRWADASHKKMANLLERTVDTAGLKSRKFMDGVPPAEVLMQNLNNYYETAGQTIAVDKLSLQETAVTRYQQFKNLQAALKSMD